MKWNTSLDSIVISQKFGSECQQKKAKEAKGHPLINDHCGLLKNSRCFSDSTV
jgi:hypothetical protein